MEFRTNDRAERECDNVGIDRQANLAEYGELEFVRAPRSRKHLHLHVIHMQGRDWHNDMHQNGSESPQTT